MNLSNYKLTDYNLQLVLLMYYTLEWHSFCYIEINLN